MKSIPGRVVMLGFTAALFFQLCNGIRHLFWDTGRGFALKSAYASGYAVVGASVVLTAVIWAVAYL